MAAFVVVFPGLSPSGWYLRADVDDLRERAGGLGMLGMVCALGSGLALWSAVRPARAAGALMWVAAALGALGPLSALAWRVTPWRGATVGMLDQIHLGNVITAISTEVCFSFAASVALGLAALASAREARRAGAPQLSFRTVVVGVAGLLLAGLLLGLSSSKWHGSCGWVLLPLAAATLSLTAVASVHDDEGEARGHAARAVVLGAAAVLLGVAIAGVEDAGPLESGGYALFGGRAALKVAPALVVPALLAPLALRPRGSWAGSRAAVAPLLAVAATMIAGVLVLRGALRAPRGDGGPWPTLPRGLADASACASVAPDAVVRLDGDLVRIPELEPIAASDVARITAQLDERGASSDLILAVPSTDAPFGPLGDLLAAMGRRRGARAAALGDQLVVPEGCAWVLVGGADGAMTCTQPIPFAGACVPNFEGEYADRVWTVTLEGPALATHAWSRRAGSKPIDFAVSDLGRVAEEQWRTEGGHRDPYDMRFDVAILRAPRTVTVADVLRAVATIGGVRRQQISRGGSSLYRRWSSAAFVERSAFTVVVDLAP